MDYLSKHVERLTTIFSRGNSKETKKTARALPSHVIDITQIVTDTAEADRILQTPKKDPTDP